MLDRVQNLLDKLVTLPNLLLLGNDCVLKLPEEVVRRKLARPLCNNRITAVVLTDALALEPRCWVRLGIKLYRNVLDNDAHNILVGQVRRPFDLLTLPLVESGVVALDK